MNLAKPLDLGVTPPDVASPLNEYNRRMRREAPNPKIVASCDFFDSMQKRLERSSV